MATNQQPEKLNPLQLHLLRFFSEHQVSEQDTKEIQQLIVNYYTNKADARMEEIWVEKELNAQVIEDILNSPLKKPTQN